MTTAPKAFAVATAAAPVLELVEMGAALVAAVTVAWPAPGAVCELTTTSVVGFREVGFALWLRVGWCREPVWLWEWWRREWVVPVPLR